MTLRHRLQAEAGAAVDGAAGGGAPGAAGAGEGAGEGAAGAGEGAAAAGAGLPAAAGNADWLSTVPEDWQSQLLGEGAEESHLNTLRRAPDLKVLARNYVDSQDQIRRGQIEPLQPPGEEADEAQWGDYRTRLGIPTEAADYETTLDDGLQLGDEDKSMLGKVFEAAHANNVPSSAMAPMVNAFLAARETLFETESTKQEQYRIDATAALKSTWGGSFTQNINLIRQVLIGSLPEAVREGFEHAVLPDGRKVFNSPEILVAMADWARRINPAATVVPTSGNPMKTMDDEIAALEARMGDDDWFTDVKANTRYRELLEARAAMNGEQLDVDEGS